jgi:hypothetical protein
VRPSIVAPAFVATSATSAISPALHDGIASPHARDRDQPRAHFLMLLRLYLTHGWRWVPGSPGSLVDLVQGDVVARATVALARRTHSDGRWYHLAAGPGATTLRELGALASRRFHAPPLSFAPPGLRRPALRFLVWGDARPLLESAAPYVPYLSVRTRVDTTDSHRVLRELGIEIPRVGELFAALVAQLELAQEAHDASRLAARPPARFSASRVRAAAAPHATARRS